jgi:hypothetical protein
MTGSISVFMTGEFTSILDYLFSLQLSLRYELGCRDGSALSLSLSPFLSVSDGRSIMVMSMLILLIEFLVVVGCIFLLVTLYLLCVTLICVCVCVSVCLFYTSISLANSQGKR